MIRRRPPTYHANLLPLWDHWVVEVPDAGGVHAMVLRFADAEHVAREAIATVLEVDPESFTVIVQPS
jgi:predicted RNase H-like HicB family nuclease